MSCKINTRLTSFVEIPFAIFPSWLTLYLSDPQIALHLPDKCLNGGGVWEGRVGLYCMFGCVRAERACACVCECVPACVRVHVYMCALLHV